VKKFCRLCMDTSSHSTGHPERPRFHQRAEGSPRKSPWDGRSLARPEIRLQFVMTHSELGAVRPCDQSHVEGCSRSQISLRQPGKVPSREHVFPLVVLPRTARGCPPQIGSAVIFAAPVDRSRRGCERFRAIPFCFAGFHHTFTSGSGMLRRSWAGSAKYRR